MLHVTFLHFTEVSFLYKILVVHYVDKHCYQTSIILCINMFLESDIKWSINQFKLNQMDRKKIQ